MKIVAGLGSIDEYIPYVKAGADEFFCGYVPYSWTEKYGKMCIRDSLRADRQQR